MRALTRSVEGFRQDIREALAALQNRLTEHERDDLRRFSSLELWRAGQAAAVGVLIFLLGMIVTAGPSWWSK
jgi:hypothetical protein